VAIPIFSARIACTPFILAVSPDRNNCQGLRKDVSAVKLYMAGTKSIQDAQEMRAACYPAVPEHAVASRFKEFGGIPRFLFKLYGGDEDDADQNVEQREAQKEALSDVVVYPRRIDSGEPAHAFKSLWTFT
jgi:hypothetical protein